MVEITGIAGLTSDSVGQEGVGHSNQSAIIILVLPVVLGNRLNFHLNEKQIEHSKLNHTLNKVNDF